jgi:hypothetical protein
VAGPLKVMASPDELVSGIQEISPRRQRIGEDCQARRPSNGRDTIPHREWPVTDETGAETGSATVAAAVFRTRHLDGLISAVDSGAREQRAFFLSAWPRKPLLNTWRLQVTFPVPFKIPCYS